MAHREPATGYEVIQHQQVAQTAEETEVQTSVRAGAGQGGSRLTMDFAHIINQQLYVEIWDLLGYNGF